MRAARGEAGTTMTTGPHGLSVVEALTGGPAGWGVQVTGDGGRITWAQITW
jgi:hypothetical protein